MSLTQKSHVYTRTNHIYERLLVWIAAIVLVLTSGGFSPLLSGHTPESGSPLDAGYSLIVLYTVASVATGCTAILLLRRPILLRQGFWLFAAAILPLGSTLWSPDYYETFRVTILLYPSLFSALAIAFYFSPAAIMQIGVRAAAITLISSLAVVMLMPTYGVHPGASLVQSLQTTLSNAQWGANQSVWGGAWRGIFSHKNVFGEALGVCLIFLLMAPQISPLLRVSFFGLTVICLVFARSMSPIAFSLSAFIVAAFLSSRCFSPTTTIALRLLGILLVLGVCASVAAGHSDLPFALLDRDATLSGRTTVWLYILSQLTGPLFFGLGYITGYQDIIFPSFVFQLFGAEFHHVHNGYLDTYLGLGLVGLLLFLSISLSGLRNAARLVQVRNSDFRGLARVTLVMILFYLFSSWTDVILSRGGNPIFPFAFLLMATTSIHRHQRTVLKTDPTSSIKNYSSRSYYGLRRRGSVALG